MIRRTSGNVVGLTLLFVLTMTNVLAQEREEPELPKADQRIDLPVVTVIGNRWRLDEEQKREIWRGEMREIDRLDREAALEDREGSVAERTSTSGRWKSEVLPYYNPAKAKVADVGIDESRSEVVEIFRVGF